MLLDRTDHYVDLSSRRLIREPISGPNQAGCILIVTEEKVDRSNAATDRFASSLAVFSFRSVASLR